MEGKLYILQLYHSYQVLISILNIMIAVYKNLHIAWYEQSHQCWTRPLTLLLDRIHDYVGLNPQEYEPDFDTQSIQNRMDDLDELEEARGEEEAELDS